MAELDIALLIESAFRNSLCGVYLIRFDDKADVVRHRQLDV